MGGEIKQRPEKVQGVLLKIPFKHFAPVIVSLPLGSLTFCFVTALIFKFDEVNQTVCQVKNLIPSISAITGVTPQRYIWRICIALHCTPRYAVGLLYFNYYMNQIHKIAKSQQHIYKRLVSINFWTYMVENSCLIGVSYIANVENYPLHEKMFVVFMFTSLFYELFTIILFSWCHPNMTERQKLSYKMKKGYFVTIMLFTAGLVYFFLRHRLWCEPNAFSWFSVCEYGIAITNIGFHYTGKMDFVGMAWVVGVPTTMDEDDADEETSPASSSTSVGADAVVAANNNTAASLNKLQQQQQTTIGNNNSNTDNLQSNGRHKKRQ